MGGKSKAPPPPDYSGLIAASQQAAAQSAAIARDQLAFAQRQWEESKAQQDPLIKAQIEAMNESMANAAKDRAFWEQNYKPVEEKAAQDALTFDSPENLERRAAQAGATVATQYEGARSAAEDQLRSFGVNPGQMGAGALDLGYRISEAAANAQAVNQSRDVTTQMAQALRQNVVASGRGQQQTAATELGSGVQYGATAANTGNALTSTFSSALMNPAQWTSMSNASIGQAGSLMNMGYENVLQRQQINNQASSGWGGLLGTALGIAGGKYISKFATGGAVGADHAPPAAQMNLSPQGGAIPPDAGPPPNPVDGTDTVPAMLTPGEYVIPKDVAMRRGTDALDKFVFHERIKSAQQRMQQEQAIPTIAHPQQPQAMPGGANIPRQALPMVA